MIIPEIIESANETFVLSVETEELKKAYNRLKKLLTEDCPTERNRENAEALLMRLGAKALLSAYFKEFRPDEGAELSAFLSAALPDAEKRGYGNTASALVKISDFLLIARPLLDEAYARLQPLRDETGLHASLDECNENIAFFSRALSSLERAEEGNPFGNKAKLFDLKARVKEALELEKQSLEARREALLYADTEKLFQELAEVPEREFYEYYPAFPDKISAKFIVLRTPFFDEAELYVTAAAKEEGLRYGTLSADAVPVKSAKELFLFMKNRKLAVFLRGLNARKEELFPAVLEAIKEGVTVYAPDDTAEGKLYSSAIGYATAHGYSALDVGCRYLPMPYFRDTAELFEEKGMIGGAEEYENLRACPFAGYVGLNEAARLFSAGRDWLASFRRRSDENAKRAGTYLSSVPLSQLLDAGWGAPDRFVSRGRREFDYDDIRGINPANIGKILSCEGSFFAKCGMLVRYCTLCGDDVSVWKNLSRETKSERLTMATRLLTRLLDTGTEPQVELISEEEWKGTGAGGYCMEGGKRIRYREKSTSDYNWTVQAICHECFHAFQHAAVDGGYRDWFFSDLGVTRGRVDEWRFNFSNYDGDTSSVTYKVEIVECDARAFQHDCFTMSEEILHKIDFE